MFKYIQRLFKRFLRDLPSIKPCEFQFLTVTSITIEYKDREPIILVNNEEFAKLPKLYWVLREFDNEFIFNGILRRLPSYLDYPEIIITLTDNDNPEMDKIIQRELDRLEKRIEHIDTDWPRINLCTYCFTYHSFYRDAKKYVDDLEQSNSSVSVIIDIKKYEGHYPHDKRKFVNKILFAGRR